MLAFHQLSHNTYDLLYIAVLGDISLLGLNW